MSSPKSPYAKPHCPTRIVQQAERTQRVATYGSRWAELNAGRSKRRHRKPAQGTPFDASGVLGLPTDPEAFPAAPTPQNASGEESGGAE